MNLPIVDDFDVDLTDGTIKSWACAHNDLLSDVSHKERLGRCPAPDGQCPRGYTKTFECRTRDPSASE